MQVKTFLKNYKGPLEIRFVKKPWYCIVPKKDEWKHHEDEIKRIFHTPKRLILYTEIQEYELDTDIDDDLLPWN